MSRTLPPPTIRRTGLRARISLHFVLFATVLLFLMTFGAWVVLTDTEDAVLDRYLVQTLPVLASDQESLAWLEIFSGPEAVGDRLPLESVPVKPGWYTIFASEDRQKARWIRDWRDTLAVWSRSDMEHEYRLHVAPSRSTGALEWRLVDLAPLEYTEGRVPALQGWLAGIGLAVLAIALLSSSRLARSAMAPVIELAMQIGNHDAERGPLAERFPRDDVGMLARALDDAWARERRALERERRFISECSHELRTPLTILQGTLDLFGEEVVDQPEARARLERLKRTARRLERLAQTFLVMAREERARSNRNAQPLADRLREVIEDQRQLFPHHRKEITLDVPSDASVDGDEEVLLVLLRNLLANSFQHAASSALRIEWHTHSGAHLRFVEQGDVAPEWIDGPPAGSSYGLGLPLVRRLARQQGWRFEESIDRSGGSSCAIWFDEEGRESSTEPPAVAAFESP